MMIGVERYKVVLAPHDENWADEYKTTQNEIKSILGDNIIEIHHVGSTAIKGISAKPILDVAVVIKAWNRSIFQEWLKRDTNMSVTVKTQASICLYAGFTGLALKNMFLLITLLVT